ncbi:hypothetical protein DPMN_127767 [Dreissena polymorpha]|uniref:Uncharacterized protein n=1 Tax=Dreissena polymorpha TaxID=45954 RepID=A0A9D4H1U9_DREPO|nr:hypothetical protein DPMN_127767 [Dreissena polymorpha]
MFYYSQIGINALTPYIIGTNLLIKFHEDWTIHVTFREKCPPPGGHVLQQTRTIFELIQEIIRTNRVKKKNAQPPVLRRKNLLTKFHDDQIINIASREKNGPPSGSNVFQLTRTI